MDKLWSSFEERSTEHDVDVEIVKELFFSTNKYKIGDIRELFNSWSIADLQSTAESIHYSTSEEDEVEESNLFGEASYYSNHPFRECLILQSIGDEMWKQCNRKKKFF
ncbi:hypothetical protein V6B14_23330 (plasmid) [Sporosarcina psychrophila]|uniref:hypothetical protein n=1 Tax=Sporosarcina psychrophila TaxID=1476 RepID=UPI0030D50FC3